MHYFYHSGFLNYFTIFHKHGNCLFYLLLKILIFDDGSTLIPFWPAFREAFYHNRPDIDSYYFISFFAGNNAVIMLIIENANKEIPPQKTPWGNMEEMNRYGWATLQANAAKMIRPNIN